MKRDSEKRCQPESYEMAEWAQRELQTQTEISLLRGKVKELDRLNRELETIIENSYDVIYITDREGKTLRTNTAIERITGIPKEYYAGKNVNNLVERGILKESVTSKVVEKGKPVTIVQTNFEGKETLITGSPIFNEAGEIEKVVTNIRDLSELNQLHSELKIAHQLNDQYKKELEKWKTKPQRDPDVILVSQPMKELYEVADRLAGVDATVLILGETGVGKDNLARHLYHSSHRHDAGQFIKVNCGAIPSELLETELFGYEAGAFTGAQKSGKAGMFELADKGVLFLDEVGELPLSLQVKLLRVLQEREIQRVGATKSKKVDVRVIAATHRDLKKMVNEGKFREDLYYRLHVIPLYVPALRDRRDDILPLVQSYLDKGNVKYQISKEFDCYLREFFYQYEWPGNVRELSNLVERLILTVPTKTISYGDLPLEYRDNHTSLSKAIQGSKAKAADGTKSEYAYSSSLKEAVEAVEREVLTRAVQSYESTYQIAEALQTSQATIVRKLQKYNLHTDAKMNQTIQK